MSSNPKIDFAVEQQGHRFAAGSVVELVAVLTVLVFILCAAAALLLATPQSANPDLRSGGGVVNTAGAAPPPPAERPFHERYPVNAAGESVDPPTF
jgi:hypothetical protein